MTDAKLTPLQLACRYGILALLVLVLYGSSLTHGFVWDDTDIIVNNPLFEKLSNIPRFFLTEDTVEESTGYYRPLTYVSFALDRAVWGVNPAGYHFTNLVLQVCAVLIFFTVVRALFGKERLAFIAALIFALHPVAGETVNFLSGGRNTLLSACCALLALYFFIRERQIPALAWYTAAVFSKEFALLLPAVFLLYDVRIRKQFRVKVYLPYLAPIAVYLALRSLAVQKANFLGAINLSDAVTAPYLVVRYALNVLFPLHLKVLYEVKLSMVTGVACLALVAVLLCAVFWFRKNEEIFISSLWFFLFLLPVVNIIPLHTTTVMADRYAYFSLMGAAIFLASIIARLNGRAATATVAGLCTVYAGVDIRRTGYWKNDTAFFSRMTMDAPDRFAGFKNLGMIHYKKGDREQALRMLELSDSRPDIPFRYLVGNAYIYWKENRLDLAEKALLKAMQENPSSPEPYLMLILMYEREGNAAMARTYRERSKEMLKDFDTILADRVVELCRLGEKLLARKQYADAEIYLWQALKINPAYVPALIDMASLKAEQGDFASARQYLDSVLAIEPVNASAHYNLAMIYRMQGRYADAEQEMNRYRALEAASRQKGGQTGN